MTNSKLFWLVLLIATLLSCTPKNKWFSKVSGNNIGYKISKPKVPKKDFYGKYATVVYLKNLNFKKIGRNSNAKDVKWLLSQGYYVFELNYKKNKNAVPTNINQDIIAINDSLATGNFCGFKNCSISKSYILFEGYRIMPDVPYFKDDPTVYNTPNEYTNGDMLYMDIIYPANTSVAVPIILSFSYSNSHATYNTEKGKLTNTNKNLRMYLPYTFAGFNDSFLEGAPAHGMAWAIADHPKYCPWGSGKPKNGKNDTYKSYQTNPDAAQKVKSAVRTLRATGKAIGLSKHIGIYGFSRGATAGAMAIGDRKVPKFENAGFYTDVSSNIQAATIGPGVFDYTIIYNTLNDGDFNLETRCPWAWGKLDNHFNLWKTMGATYLAKTAASAPTLFFYNTTDALYYTEQANYFKAKLDSLNVPTQSLIDYGQGHTVPQTNESLDYLYSFFKKHLNTPLVKND
ncbi:MAG: alpha/beta hydrolase family protein [Aestuariibaculum sp.]